MALFFPPLLIAASSQEECRMSRAHRCERYRQGVHVANWWEDSAWAEARTILSQSHTNQSHTNCEQPPSRALREAHSREAHSGEAQCNDANQQQRQPASEANQQQRQPAMVDPLRWREKTLAPSRCVAPTF